MTQQTDGGESTPGLFAALRNSLATLLAIGKTRAELLITELEEEKIRLVSLWSKAIGAAFLLAMGVFLSIFCLALAFWEQRALIFGIFAVLFMAGGFFLLLAVRRESARPEKLLRSSLAELEADIEQLRAHVRQPHE